MKSNEHITRIASETAARVATKEAAKIAAEIAIETYKAEQSKDAKKRSDWRLRNTKLLLKNYRSFVAHVENAVYDADKVTDESALTILDMVGSYSGSSSASIESIMRSTARTSVIVAHIKEMLNIYGAMCKISGNSEEMRRHRVIYLLFIDVNQMSISEIAEAENVVERTIYRDCDIAFERLAALFFGIDGLQKP